MSVSPVGRAGSLSVGLATAIVLVVVALAPFLTPQWVAFEQGRAQAAAWTGYDPVELRTATDSILSDLVVGPPAFDAVVGGQPVLNERERGHMRDVRAVFIGLFVLAAGSVVVLALGARARDRAAVWRAVGRGASVLAVAIMALGLVALVAFDRLFEVFHRLLFAGGSYTFDPGSERLVQLFPFAFWQETAIVVGVVIVGLAAAAAVVARRRSVGLQERPVGRRRADAVPRARA